MAHSPCFFTPLANSPLFPFPTPFYLLGTPPSCDRICPPRSQVACKLTSPDPPFPQTLPLQIPRTQIAQRLTTMTSGSIRHLLSGTIIVYTHLYMLITRPTYLQISPCISTYADISSNPSFNNLPFLLVLK